MSAIRRDVLKGWTVVVVDDETDSLDVATRILKHYGATTYTASNGAEGVVLIRSVMPRFVISDLSMPVMDGWEMLSTMQQDSAITGIPVIALTAHAMPGDQQRAVKAGFMNYLTKPLTPATFMDDLLRLLLDNPQFAVELERN